jgi:hypothetical protein
MERHRTDAVSFVAGMLFVGVGVMLMLDRAGVVDSDLRWLPPVVLVVIGLALLVTSVVRAATARADVREIAGQDTANSSSSSAGATDSSWS